MKKEMAIASLMLISPSVLTTQALAHEAALVQSQEKSIYFFSNQELKRPVYKYEDGTLTTYPTENFVGYEMYSLSMQFAPVVSYEVDGSPNIRLTKGSEANTLELDNLAPRKGQKEYAVTITSRSTFGSHSIDDEFYAVAKNGNIYLFDCSSSLRCTANNYLVMKQKKDQSLELVRTHGYTNKDIEDFFNQKIIFKGYKSL